MQGAIWHPCTQMGEVREHPLLRIVKGQGIYLYDAAGKRYMDAVASWWVNLFGHGNERIARAIREQAGVLEQVIMAGVTHEKAEEMVDLLLPLLPPGLKHVYFASDGASSVEVAMKMSVGHYRRKGQTERGKFLFLKNGYHGDTMGALSVCGDGGFTEETGLPPRNIMVEAPDCFRCPYGKERGSCNVECFEHMERAIADHKHEACAAIVEPLVQGASGMRMYPARYLTKLRKATRDADMHLICDEIAVGFGRTGTMFASEQADISPDLMTVGKGLTGGTLPLSLCLTTDEVYESFLGAWPNAFMHSHSFGGNALACAAGVETLKIFREENVLENNRAKAEHLAAYTRERFAGHPHVGEVRTTGFITALELVDDPQTRKGFAPERRTGFHVYRAAMQRGALMRNMKDVMYFIPPYIITKEEIETMVDIAYDSVQEVLE
ncbi:MAG: adenosylmethionine--8-amino-7-oxononanoate transaminase [Desulfovibrio sp.]|uniref:adenosylmethionine--8-amino-7-oxononanoate transaminase n=1 Tax=Desulfovibrio sp. 7SRBS1 TaxID=3378064 RepID=UPI003B412C5B